MVVNEAPASLAANTNRVMEIATGVDSKAAGQTTTIDTDVPTGSVLKYIDIRFSISNLVLVAMFCHLLVWQKRTGQGSINPNAVGGNPLRNQVFHQDMFMVGQNQNTNRTIRFKIPKQFQRVRDGSEWQLVVRAHQTNNNAAQFVYKYYR